MTVGNLIKHLEGYDPETPCSYDLWLPDDVRTIAADHLPVDEAAGGITDEEIEETLERVYKLRDAEFGTTWQTLVDCMPESVQNRMDLI